MAGNNQLPSHDGEWTLYTPSKLGGSAAMAGQLLIYVNGMNTFPEEHRRASMAFANELRHDVWGCYNRIGAFFTVSVRDTIVRLRQGINQAKLPAPLKIALEQVCSVYLTEADTANTLCSFLSDISQCLDDWMTPQRTLETEAVGHLAVNTAPHAAREGFLAMQTGEIDAVFGPILGPIFARKARDATNTAINRVTGATAKFTDNLKLDVKLAIALLILNGNSASLSLFERLYVAQRQGGVIRIICHSQGNLIVANVLTLLTWVCNNRCNSIFHVWGLASPVNVLGWPRSMRGFKLHLYTNKQDFVTWLSLGESYLAPNAKVFKASSGLGAHDIKLYNSQPAFLTNIKGEMQVR